MNNNPRSYRIDADVGILIDKDCKIDLFWRCIMNNILVLQTDFGTSDGAVSAMYGVALNVNPKIQIYDLTHEIPPFNIWEASYRLYQTIKYWPENTVFISVVDPGVGSNRKSIAVKTETNHYIVTPDNGSITHVWNYFGIKEARIIDEKINRLPNSGESYTFHGRDVYAYTGAKLTSKVISFEQIGPQIDVDELVYLNVVAPSIDNDAIKGRIDILDVRFGNLWTNIERTFFNALEVCYGERMEVTIKNGMHEVYRDSLVYGRTFADAKLGTPLLFVNSLDKIGIAINQGSFAKTFQINSGPDWEIIIRKNEK